MGNKMQASGWQIALALTKDKEDAFSDAMNIKTVFFSVQGTDSQCIY